MFFETCGDLAAYQITQGVYAGVGDHVVGCRSSAGAFHQSCLRQLTQMFGDIGLAAADPGAEFSDIAFTLPQDVQNLQPRRLRQQLEVIRDMLEGLVVQFRQGLTGLELVVGYDNSLVDYITT